MSIRRYDKNGYLKRTIKERLLNMLGIRIPSRECMRSLQGDPSAVSPLNKYGINKKEEENEH